MSTTNSKWLPPQQEGFGPWIEFTGEPSVCPVPYHTEVCYLTKREQERKEYDDHPNHVAGEQGWHSCAAYCVKLDGLQAQQPAASDRPVQAQSPDTALSVQVAGDHYKRLAIQPIEYIHANGMTYLAGNVVKYISRHKAKGGADDVRKAIHYCELILELEYKNGKTD